LNDSNYHVDLNSFLALWIIGPLLHFFLVTGYVLSYVSMYQHTLRNVQ